MLPDNHILSPAKVLAYILAKEKSDLPVYVVGSSGLQVSVSFFFGILFYCFSDMVSYFRKNYKKKE